MIFVVIGIVFVIINLVIYNSIVKRKNKVLRNKANIEVYLEQRFNLIPNLVECVKKYTDYEHKTLEELTDIRAKYFNEKNISDGEILNTKLSNVIMQVEAYPELKANEQFLLLEKNLVKIENQIQAARRVYNLSVYKYNKLVVSFPINIFCKIMKYGEEKYFEANDECKNNVIVDVK